MGIWNRIKQLHFWYQKRRLAKQIIKMIEGEENQVIEEVWASPEEDARSIVAWIEEQITATPSIPGLQWYKIFVCHCPEELYDAVMRGEDIELDEPIAEWMGPSKRWWSEGQDTIKRGIPETHQGLAIILTNLAASISAKLHADDKPA